MHVHNDLGLAVANTLASDAPNLVSRVSVNEDGNIVLDVKPIGFMLIIK